MTLEEEKEYLQKCEEYAKAYVEEITPTADEISEILARWFNPCLTMFIRLTAENEKGILNGVQDNMEEGIEMGYIDCSECKYCSLSADEYPCRICYPMITGKVSLFEPKSDVPEQPTVPPMPKVKPPRGRELSGCLDCRHFECDSEEYPCSDCKHTFNAKSENEHFSPINEKLEDINHPDRYAGGRYECIDVMVDAFGVQAVKDFCKLNAFKYLWREEKKGGIEDAKKAIWYLEKFIELGEKMTLNEAIEMTESFARYVRKFPNILLSMAEIERIIGINRTGV